MLYMVTDGFSLQNNTKKQFLRKVANSVILGSKNLEKKVLQNPSGTEQWYIQHPQTIQQFYSNAILINNTGLFFHCVSAGLSKRKSLTITPNCLVSTGEWCHGWAAITSVLYNIWIRVEKAGSHAFICHKKDATHAPKSYTASYWTLPILVHWFIKLIKSERHFEVGQTLKCNA